MIPLKGFTPDAPTTTPGILLDCTDFIPYESGMRSAPSPSVVASALAAECRGARTLTQLSGTRRVFAGTAAGLYELNGTSWTDRSRGAGYSLGAQSEWSFAQFGDTSVAANIDTTIQTSSSGAFADQATAPKAAIVESVMSSGGGFVFAFNTIDATYGTSTDRWWCSALNDVTNWTPSVSSQCTTGRIIGGTGTITAAKSLGSDRIVAYKSNSLYIGTYIGPPTVWAWQEVPVFGCAGLNAVADLGTIHFVVGQDDIYLFDGARPIPIADNKTRRWFIDNSSGTYRYKTKVIYDRTYDLVWVFFPSASSSTGMCDMCLVYHMKTGEWGRYDRTVEAAFLYNVPGETFDGSSGTTFDADTGIFDQVSPGSQIPAFFDSSHILNTINGTPVSAYMTLHDIGDDKIVTSLTEARLQYMVAPTSSSLSAYSHMATSNSLTSLPGSFTSYDVPGNGKNIFPLRQSGRWHRLVFSFTGLVKVVGYDVPLKQAGNR